MEIGVYGFPSSLGRNDLWEGGVTAMNTPKHVKQRPARTQAQPAGRRSPASTARGRLSIEAWKSSTSANTAWEDFGQSSRGEFLTTEVIGLEVKRHRGFAMAGPRRPDPARPAGSNLPP